MTEKPKEVKELTIRSILCAIAVAAIMGASYPYVVLKLGFGPNTSVVAAFFGFIALGLIFKDYNRWENNMVQTAGTAAAQMAFMCVLLGAFDMLRESKNVNFTMTLTPLDSFLWLTTAGLLGVFLSVPMRRHYIVDEQLPYADGLAAGTTLMVLDSRGPEAKRAAKVMVLALLASAALMCLTEDAHILTKALPSVIGIGTALMMSMGVGVNISLLSIGSGMIVGSRINVSMLIGGILSWIVAPYALQHYGILGGDTLKRTNVLFWVMWPATGMLVAGGLAALFLKWRVLVRSFKSLSGVQVNSGDFPMKWVVVGAVLSGTALVVVQKVMLGLPVWMTIVAILLSVPLMLVCLRVLGETNWAPISAVSNMMQGVFGVLAPGHIQANMLASGTTGSVATGSEALMQDFKAGHMIGSTPKFMTYMQIIGTPIGAAAVSLMYPLLVRTYGITGENAQLSSPISRKWAGFAEILSKGADALPKGALAFLVIGAILGVLFPILEEKLPKKYVPSATGVGIGMLVPFAVIFMMFVGGLVDDLWRMKSAKTNELYATPLASGLIAGEAIVAVIIPILVVLGLLHV
jgi:uncharacterized oligopeptide transporter (OPT) family protein